MQSKQPTQKLPTSTETTKSKDTLIFHAKNIKDFATKINALKTECGPEKPVDNSMLLHLTRETLTQCKQLIKLIQSFSEKE